MAELSSEKIKKLKRGELIGNIATIACGIVLIYFIVAFSVGTVKEIQALKTAALVSAPLLTAIAGGIAAYCYVRFGGETDKLIKEYVVNVMVENAALMHPERESLTFNFSLEGNVAEIKVNGYKEKIVFDFSAFGRLSLVRKATIGSALETRLCVTFIRLLERGGKFDSVCYVSTAGKKSGKPVYIIENGAPDKKALKIYLKNK